jgi:hypothetical protein
MTLRELWNGLLDFNLIWVLIPIFLLVAWFSMKGLFYWFKLFTEKEVDDWKDGERVQYTRSFISIIMRTVVAIFISGNVIVGFFIMLDFLIELL